MDISKYALFADVADTGNFTKSGERMGYTQPGVSHILKAMEADFGFPLFVKFPVSATSAKSAYLLMSIKSLPPKIKRGHTLSVVLHRLLTL